MEETQTKIPTGTWDKLSTEVSERKPKVEFEINKSVQVVFTSNEPTEFQGDNGAYYLFDVEVNSEQKVIMTSAWSLLRGLKILSPLAGKKIVITKVMEKGKQHFEVQEVKTTA